MFDKWNEEEGFSFRLVLRHVSRGLHQSVVKYEYERMHSRNHDSESDNYGMSQPPDEYRRLMSTAAPPPPSLLMIAQPAGCGRGMPARALHCYGGW